MQFAEFIHQHYQYGEIHVNQISPEVEEKTGKISVTYTPSQQEPRELKDEIEEKDKDRDHAMRVASPKPACPPEARRRRET